MSCGGLRSSPTSGATRPEASRRLRSLLSVDPIAGLGIEEVQPVRLDRELDRLPLVGTGRRVEPGHEQTALPPRLLPGRLERLLTYGLGNGSALDGRDADAEVGVHLGAHEERLRQIGRAHV